MKAIEVFNTVAKKQVDSNVLGVLISETKAVVYAISDKQYNWLIGSVCQEYKNWDGYSCAISFNDENYTYTINPKHKTNNVPHYIPNRKQYGATHFIIKTLKND